MRRVIAWGGGAALAVAAIAGGLRAQEPQPSEKKYRDFAEVTKGAERIDGLFTLHKKDEHLYAEIKQNQFDQPLLVPTTIARGIAQAGMPIGDDDMVLVFRK